MSQINNIDEYHEAISHLASYKNSYSTYQQLSELENSHNDLINRVITKFENEFVNQIKNDQNIKIKESSESREFEKFFIEKIEEYYRAKSSSSIELKKQYNYFHRNGKDHSRICTSPTTSDLAIGDKRSIDSIYQLILKHEESLLPTFIQLKKNFDSLDILVEQFMTDIKEVIHQTDRASLRGKCKYEYGFFPNNMIHRFKSAK